MLLTCAVNSDTRKLTLYIFNFFNSETGESDFSDVDKDWDLHDVQGNINEIYNEDNLKGKVPNNVNQNYVNMLKKLKKVMVSSRYPYVKPPQGEAGLSLRKTTGVRYFAKSKTSYFSDWTFNNFNLLTNVSLT